MNERLVIIAAAIVLAAVIVRFPAGSTGRYQLVAAGSAGVAVARIDTVTGEVDWATPSSSWWPIR